MAHVTHLIGIETEQIEDMKYLIEMARGKLDEMESLLNSIETERPEDLSSSKAKEEHLKYPLNQFRIIRRFDRQWPQVFGLGKRGTFKVLYSTIQPKVKCASRLII